MQSSFDMSVEFVLCQLLIPLRGEKRFKPCPQSHILVPLRGGGTFPKFLTSNSFLFIWKSHGGYSQVWNAYKQSPLHDAYHSGYKQQLLVFSVTPFKTDQNKKSKPFNRLSLESGNRKKVDMQTLAKIQVKAIFLMGDMGRNVFPKFIEICMETPCWCPPRWAPTWRSETSRNICH